MPLPCAAVDAPACMICSGTRCLAASCTAGGLAGEQGASVQG